MKTKVCFQVNIDEFSYLIWIDFSAFKSVIASFSGEKSESLHYTIDYPPQPKNEDDLKL